MREKNWMWCVVIGFVFLIIISLTLLLQHNYNLPKPIPVEEFARQWQTGLGAIFGFLALVTAEALRVSNEMKAREKQNEQRAISHLYLIRGQIITIGEYLDLSMDTIRIAEERRDRELPYVNLSAIERETIQIGLESLSETLSVDVFSISWHFSDQLEQEIGRFMQQRSLCASIIRLVTFNAEKACDSHKIDGIVFDRAKVVILNAKDQISNLVRIINDNLSERGIVLGSEREFQNGADSVKVRNASKGVIDSGRWTGN